jgi:hypothetical protein
MITEDQKVRRREFTGDQKGRRREIARLIHRRSEGHEAENLGGK